MTQDMTLNARLDRLRQRFIQTYYSRHDELEVLLDASLQSGLARNSMAEAEMILHKIAGSAGSLGMAQLGDAARSVETFIRAHLAQPEPDFEAMQAALNAYLDVSMDVCNPTERLLNVG